MPFQGSFRRLFQPDFQVYFLMLRSGSDFPDEIRNRIEKDALFSYTIREG